MAANKRRLPRVTLRRITKISKHRHGDFSIFRSGFKTDIETDFSWSSIEVEIDYSYNDLDLQSEMEMEISFVVLLVGSTMCMLLPTS